MFGDFYVQSQHKKHKNESTVFFRNFDFFRNADFLLKNDDIH